MESKHPGYPYAMRDFRAYLLKQNLDVKQYLSWLGDDKVLKELFLKGWENPNKSELLEACNHTPFYRFPIEKQRLLYCHIMFEKLLDRRVLLEKYKKLVNTKKQLLLLEIAQKCLVTGTPLPKIRHDKRSQRNAPKLRWESHPVPWSIHDEPELWTSKQERSTCLTQLEKLGLVQCLRLGRKTTAVAITHAAVEWIAHTTWPAEPDKETIVKIYYDLSQKYRKNAG